MCPFLRDRTRVLHALGRRLRPGGALVVITPTAEHTPPERRDIALDEDEISLLTAGWKEVERLEADELAVLVLRGPCDTTTTAMEKRPPTPHALTGGWREVVVFAAALRDATHWDEVVTSLGHEHLRRHDLRHTGLTWFADAGVPAHVLRKIAGHGSLLTTQRYLHPDMTQIANAGHALTTHLNPIRTPLTLAVQPTAGRRR
ncbi:tyrosine-type recombinase/integrase [Streptomyces sp. NBC_01618]|uniref:tyrosine-type recombinase/integrase n=1 Tax=Streptomyces sp. NBC_01618 TaxID=2975900 RepID=UPI003864C9AA